MRKTPEGHAPVSLGPEELALIDVVAPFQDGEGHTAEEALEMARKRTKAWMQAAEPTDMSA